MQAGVNLPDSLNISLVGLEERMWRLGGFSLAPSAVPVVGSLKTNYRWMCGRGNALNAELPMTVTLMQRVTF